MIPELSLSANDPSSISHNPSLSYTLNIVGGSVTSISYSDTQCQTVSSTTSEPTTCTQSSINTALYRKLTQYAATDAPAAGTLVSSGSWVQYAYYTDNSCATGNTLNAFQVNTCLPDSSSASSYFMSIAYQYASGFPGKASLGYVTISTNSFSDAQCTTQIAAAVSYTYMTIPVGGCYSLTNAVSGWSSMQGYITTTSTPVMTSVGSW
jgi:hypothetical protein